MGGGDHRDGDLLRGARQGGVVQEARGTEGVTGAAGGTVQLFHEVLVTVGRAAALAADPRVRTGEPPAGVLERAVVLADAHAPLTLDEPLRVWCERGESEVPGVLTVRSVRAVHRGESSPRRMPRDHAGCAVHPADTDRRLEDRVGHHG